jgi:hypothetical protein
LERREKRFSSIDEDDDQVLMCKDLPHYMTPYQDADPVTETTRGQQSTSPAISQRTKVSSSSFRGRQPNKETFLLIKSKHFSSFLWSWSSCWLFYLEPLFGCLCEARSPLLFKFQLGDFPFFLDFRHHISGGDAKHFSWEDSVLFDNKTKSQHRH